MDFSKVIVDLEIICMLSRDLSYKLVELMFESKAPDQIFFMFQVL